MTKQQQSIGKHGQELAANTLRGLGVNMVEKIGTPVLLIPGSQKGQFKVIYEEPASDDHRGILTDGTSVLAETKTILDRNLRWSDLREHQPGRLDEHHKHNGLSLLVWVHSEGVFVIEWPIFDFKPGGSITPAEAKFLHITQL